MHQPGDVPPPACFLYLEEAGTVVLGNWELRKTDLVVAKFR